MNKLIDMNTNSKKNNNQINSNRNIKRIALIGLDGSGKSTNIGQMKKDLDYSQYQFVWVRWKPILLKPAYWILKRMLAKKKSGNGYNDEGVTIEDSHKIPPRTELNEIYKDKTGLKSKIFKSPILRNVWMSVALVDYYMQFYVKVIKFILMNKDIIFDRFYLDLFVDQGINFGFLPSQIEEEIKKHQWLFPWIDRYIYIRVSPETCLQRKDDIPNIDYLLKRYYVYEHLAKDKKWVTVDGEKSPEDVYRNIKKLIIG